MEHAWVLLPNTPIRSLRNMKGMRRCANITPVISLHMEPGAVGIKVPLNADTHVSIGHTCTWINPLARPWVLGSQTSGTRKPGRRRAEGQAGKGGELRDRVQGAGGLRQGWNPHLRLTPQADGELGSGAVGDKYDRQKGKMEWKT